MPFIYNWTNGGWFRSRQKAHVKMQTKSFAGYGSKFTSMEKTAVYSLVFCYDIEKEVELMEAIFRWTERVITCKSGKICKNLVVIILIRNRKLVWIFRYFNYNFQAVKKSVLDLKKSIWQMDNLSFCVTRNCRDRRRVLDSMIAVDTSRTRLNSFWHVKQSTFIQFESLHRKTIWNRLLWGASC